MKRYFIFLFFVALLMCSGIMQGQVVAGSEQGFMPPFNDAQHRRGDVTGDGRIDVDDLNAIINVMVGKTGPLDGEAFSLHDLSGDGCIDVDDINLLINIMLGVPETRTYTVNGVTFKMVFVEGGTFMMGATSEQDGNAYNDEKPSHQVTLNSFSIGVTEVTQELWQAVMSSNPSQFKSSHHPVERVSWNDCQKFITKLNALTGETFRLPSEAEWEYAARGGVKSKGTAHAGSGTIGDVAWYCDNSYALGTANANYGPQDVGTKAPNELGLYDMSGNVEEWCQDWYGRHNSDSQTDPAGATSGISRVLRGGSWCTCAAYCRTSSRYFCPPTIKFNYLGLRLAR